MPLPALSIASGRASWPKLIASWVSLACINLLASCGLVVGDDDAHKTQGAARPSRRSAPLQRSVQAVYSTLPAYRSPEDALEDEEHAANVLATPSFAPVELQGHQLSPAPRESGGHRYGRSRRRRKSGRPSRSTCLIDVVERTGQHHALPAVAVRKPHLSRVRPPASERGRLSHSPQVSDFTGSGVSLQSILSKYIGHSHQVSNSNQPMNSAGTARHPKDQRFHFISQKERTFLSYRGYQLHDVHSWASLLLAPDPDIEARLKGAAHGARMRTDIKGSTRLPIFIVLFLLRRHHLSNAALRAILVHLWKRVRGRPCDLADEVTESSSTPTNSNDLPVSSTSSVSLEKDFPDESTAFIVFVRLVRHARQVWPPALVNITALLIMHLEDSARGTTHDPPVPSLKRTNHLTFWYNRALSLLSIPCSMNPFSSSVMQERAQFDILKRMAAHEPPLTITQEGYRAVTRVQLAREKTANEQDWAVMKARSWPPWKEDRTRVDMEKGPEHGISRAAHSILRMQEAGYAEGEWEKVAKIYAGWDTDASPTIQTRHIMRSLPRSSDIKLQGPESQTEDKIKDFEKEAEIEIWAARVRATRTLPEAWACFLSYKDSKAPLHQAVFLALFEKIVYNDKRASATDKKGAAYVEDAFGRMTPTALPGDGKEVFPAPISPNEAVYLRSQPPALNFASSIMINEGVRPCGDCLMFLIAHSESIRMALKVLRASDDVHAATIYNLSSTPTEPESGLHDIPDKLFTTFIQLLCRRRLDRSARLFGEPVESHILPGWTLNRRLPLVHAFHLVSIKKPLYRPAWNALLGVMALSQHAVAVLTPDTSPLVNEVLRLKLMQKLVATMEELHLRLDADGFQYVCIGALRAAIAIQDLASQVASQRTRNDVPSEPEDPYAGTSQSLARVSRYLRFLFHSLVGSSNADPAVTSLTVSDSTIPPIPRLLVTPNPAQLHAYVRALGFCRDYEGIYSLAKWMVEYRDELLGRIERSRGGWTLYRRTLIAFRVFLERNWERSPTKKSKGAASRRVEVEAAPEELVLLVSELVESVPEWGGWPGEEEVEAYVEGGRFTYQHSVREKRAHNLSRWI